MTSIETALRQILIDNSDVSDLVEDRVFPDILTQASAFPAIVFRVVSGDTKYNMGGSSNIAEKRVQFDCFAATKDGVITLRDKLMKALSGFSGSVGSPAIRIQGAFKLAEIDFFEPGTDAPGPRTWRKIIDFQIWHEESFT